MSYTEFKDGYAREIRMSRNIFIHARTMNDSYISLMEII